MEATATQPATRSRAQAIRDKVEIRLALGEDIGQEIAGVLAANGIDLPHADWSGPMPSWLIACVDSEVVGCCQVLVSKPVGYVEFLLVKPQTPFKLRAIAIRKLIIQSMATLSIAGCQYVGGVVSKENRKFADVLTKLNFAKTYPADIFVKRIA